MRGGNKRSAAHSARRLQATGLQSADRKLRLESLEDRRLLAIDFNLLVDTVPGPGQDYFIPGTPVEFHDHFYFSAGSGAAGFWKSDGTPQGTTFVETGVAVQTAFVRSGEALFFMGGDGALWKTDGTTEGTVLVKGLPDGQPFFPAYIVDVSDTLYFRADDRVHGYELWKSDGTTDGTVMVKDVIPGPAASWPRLLTNVGGVLYYTAERTADDRELWRSDGTAEGTFLVKDIVPGTTTSVPINLTNVGGKLYFIATDQFGPEVWTSDGSEAGTIRLTDFTAPSYQSYPTQFTDLGGQLYFIGPEAATGLRTQLWKSDGTLDGTVKVFEVPPRPGSARGIEELENVGGGLYFTANLSQIWKSDGTADGSALVKTFTPKSVQFADLSDVAGELYFRVNDGSHGLEPWRSDGTLAGTKLVEDVVPGGGSSVPTPYFGRSPFFAMKGRVFANFKTAAYGIEIWGADLQPRNGDYDGDDVVDGADLLVWQRRLGDPVDPVGTNPDGDYSGVIDAGDLAVWQTKVPATAVAAAAAPASASRANDAALVDAALATMRFDQPPAGKRTGFLRPR